MRVDDASRSDVERQRADPSIDAGCGPTRIEATAKARAVDTSTEHHRPDYGGQHEPSACLDTCTLPVLACGLPIRPVLKHGPRSLTCVRVNSASKPMSLPTLEMAQLEVGSSGWKSTTRLMVFDAPPTALENSEDQVPSALGCTHNRIRSPRWTVSGQWNNVGKESQQNGSVTSGKRLPLRLGTGIPVPNPSTVDGLLELLLQ
ncbi:Hypothetical predicted protein [Olea europaea subsp. europaea]|uniref:Uncharacterized protein n=1 Tax=Olea europaea subsp. europaea TaxID=158383 RepID=A0A8S0QZJ9_OLEEU|nr:Hypothetical predicted protein [Olea europaea subsp. europaea]